MLFPGTLVRLRVACVVLLNIRQTEGRCCCVVPMDISQTEGRCCCSHGH